VGKRGAISRIKVVHSVGGMWVGELLGDRRGPTGLGYCGDTFMFYTTHRFHPNGEGNIESTVQPLLWRIRHGHQLPQKDGGKGGVYIFFDSWGRLWASTI